MAPTPVDDPDAYVRELIAQELAKQRRQRQPSSASAGAGRSSAAAAAAAALVLQNHSNDESRKQNDATELQEMKAWIDTLPDDGIELLRCMEFDFISPSYSADCTAYGMSDQDTGATSSRCLDDDNGSSDILLQLLQSQVPPPTPIHPRAVTYKSASCAISRGATDGRDEEERVRRERFFRPRLFQLVEQSSRGAAGLNGGGRGPRTGSRRTGRVATRQQQSAASCARRYDVIARKFVTAWGDVLSLGSTETQRLADDIILAGMVLTPDLEQQVGAIDGIVTPSMQQQQSIRRRCQLCVPKSFSSCSRTTGGRKREILHILHVASRGRFLSVAPNNKSSSHLPFCAPWFTPTSEWFSLTMFLSSRLEGALWDSYLRKKKGTLGETTSSSSQLNFMSAYSETELERSFQIATVKSLAELLAREDTELVRDGRLWRILFSSNCLPGWTRYSSIQSESSGTTTIRSSFQSLMLLPLIESGSALDQYRCLILKYLRDILAFEAEKKLLVEVSEEEEKKTEGSAEHGTAVRCGDRRRAKKKKKRARKSRGPALKRIDEDSPNEESSILAGNSRANDIDALDEDEAFLSAKRSDSPPLPTSEKNQNTIVALQVIDEILCGVFEQVGLGLGLGSDNDDRLFVDVREKGEKRIDRRPQHYQARGWSRPRPTSSCPAQAKPCHITSLSESESPAITSKGALQDHLNTRSTSVPVGVLSRQDSTEVSSISMLAQPSNPYHQPQSSHENIFSFMDNSQSHYSMQPGGAYNSIFDDGSSPLGMSLKVGFGSSFGGWNGQERQYPSRNRSHFTDFFDDVDAQEAQDIEELLMAASTAASIASSTAYDDESDAQTVYDNESDDFRAEERGSETPEVVDETIGGVQDDEYDIPPSIDNGKVSVASRITKPGGKHVEEPDVKSSGSSNTVPQEPASTSSEVSPSLALSPQPPITPLPTFDVPQSFQSPVLSDSGSTEQSPTPSEPPTPPPQLSPIQVSLADVGKFVNAKRCKDLSIEFEKAISASASSLPGSPPRLDSSKRTWSRDDLTCLASPKDDTSMRGRRRVRSSSSHNFEEVMSYRNAVSKSIKAASTCSHELLSATGSADFTDIHRMPNAVRPRGSIPDLNRVQEKSQAGGPYHLVACARSETALDAFEDSSHVNVIQAPIHAELDNATTARDGETTISSGGTPGEAEDVTNLREERNSFRDLCLTLGAEVSKLKNTVAALQQQQNAYAHPQFEYGAAPVIQQPYLYPQPAPEFAAPTPPYFLPGYAMSDAGVQDTTKSDDGTATENYPGGDSAGLQQWPGGGAGHPTKVIQIRRPSLGCNMTVSNASVDNDAGCHGSIALSAIRSSVACPIGVPSHGLQSRLSIDINNYCMSISSQLKKQESRRLAATKRLTRLVTALWPRAQVKLYGSHVSNLCLPSSDLDFVICLPSVHKIDVATTPGVLEGRNAINETNQKVLARKLKGESWIDPRSIKVIERTVIPVIKVSTKDKRSRVLQLDISFDGPNHHGLEAIQLVTETIEEFPVCRPLMLVMKQFLLDRGLLTAYTGGMSSYGLFLMLSRYLQEQAIGSWTDCGSLLMGFLDFYGNNFDARQTGISVRNRQYFSRPYYSYQTQQFEQPIWNAPHLSPSASEMAGGDEFPDLSRRHSFADSALRNASGVGGGVSGVSSTVSGMGVPPALGSATSAMKKSPKMHASKKPPRIQTRRSSSHHSLHADYPLDTHAQKRSDQLVVPQQDVPPSAPISRPYTFDPLMMEDPLNPANNIGRNTFRIFQVLRAFSDAHRALVASLEWDMNSITEVNGDNDYPLLKSLLHNEDVFFESESGLSMQPN